MDIHNSEADCTCHRHYPQLLDEATGQEQPVHTQYESCTTGGGGGGGAERVRIGKEEVVRREESEHTTHSESLNTLHVLCVACTLKGSI